MISNKRGSDINRCYTSYS